MYHSFPLFYGFSRWLRSVSPPGVGGCTNGSELYTVGLIHSSDDEWIAKGTLTTEVEPGGTSSRVDESNPPAPTDHLPKHAVIRFSCLTWLRFSAEDIDFTIPV